MDDGIELLVIARDERSMDDGILVDTQCWAILAKSVLMAEGVISGELGLLFIDSDEMARLNLEYLGEDRPTDVLAFPLDSPTSDSSSGPVLLGDVAVCPAYVLDSSANVIPAVVGSAMRFVIRSGTCLNDEIALLVVHGVLHILGYDHVNAADASVMQAREKELLTYYSRS